MGDTARHTITPLDKYSWQIKTFLITRLHSSKTVAMRSYDMVHVGFAEVSEILNGQFFCILSPLLAGNDKKKRGR